MSITVKGTATGPVPQGRSLWIVVQYGAEWWPQPGPIVLLPRSATADYEWLVPANVGRPGDVGEEFGIVAILTPPSIDQKFREWFDAKLYPGFAVVDLIRDGAGPICGISVKRS